MGTFPGFAAGQQIGEENLARRRELEDEQRKATLKTLQEDAETPADKVAAIQAVYHKDPSALKQHVENLTRRVTGKKPQPVVSPQDAQQARIAPLAARGKTPEQQQEEAQGRERTAASTSSLDINQKEMQQKQQAVVDLIKRFVPPEQQQAALQNYAEKQAGVQSALKNIPGAAGQPVEDPPGSGRYVRPVQNQDGSIVKQAMPEGWKPLAPKPVPTLKQYVDLTTKKILADKKQGPPLTEEEQAQLAASDQGLTLAAKARAQAAAQAQAQYGVTPVYDDATGSETLQTRAQVAAAAESGNPYRPGSIGAPTAQDKTRAALAQSSIQQINTMEDILKKDPHLTGPGGGQWNQFMTMLGTNSPESQQFLAAATFLSEHGVGVFGGRNIHSINDLQNLFGNLKTNPDALIAALDQAKSTMQTFANPGGRLPAPKKPANTNKTIVQHSASTGQYRYSTDGGQTWQPGQPPK